jgi:hypothetical protein
MINVGGSSSRSDSLCGEIAIHLTAVVVRLVTVALEQIVQDSLRSIAAVAYAARQWQH